MIPFSPSFTCRPSSFHQRTGKTRKGNPWLRALLVLAADAAARRGKSRAAVAVAHSILIIAYHLFERRIFLDSDG